MAQRPQQNAQAKLLPRLSAPLTKLRKQWLSSVKELEPQAALAVLRQRLEKETEGAARLGNIAAQSWIVRQRLIGLQAALHGIAPSVDVEEPTAEAAISAPEAASAEPLPTAAVAPPDHDEADAAVQGPGWIKLRILVETEVNGMRFFEGSTIEVREEDARKLIEANSAEPVTATADPAPARVSKPTKKAAPKK
jgi:hypothetical protein